MPPAPLPPAVIMAKYGLDGRKDAQLGATNYIKGGLENDVLDDPRLEKLWNKVGGRAGGASPGTGVGKPLFTMPGCCFPRLDSRSQLCVHVQLLPWQTLAAALGLSFCMCRKEAPPPRDARPPPPTTGQGRNAG